MSDSAGSHLARHAPKCRTLAYGTPTRRAHAPESPIVPPHRWTEQGRRRYKSPYFYSTRTPTSEAAMRSHGRKYLRGDHCPSLPLRSPSHPPARKGSPIYSIWCNTHVFWHLTPTVTHRSLQARAIFLRRSSAGRSAHNSVVAYPVPIYPW